MDDQLAQLALFVSDYAETPAAVETRRFRPLSKVWTPEALSRSFLLSSDDLTQIKHCRSTANRLRFALHLTLLRFLHVAVLTLARVPDAIIHFVTHTNGACILSPDRANGRCLELITMLQLASLGCKETLQ